MFRIKVVLHAPTAKYKGEIEVPEDKAPARVWYRGTVYERVASRVMGWQVYRPESNVPLGIGNDQLEEF